MSETDIDRRLGMLLRQDMPDPDPAFAERVLNAVELEAQFAAARKRTWLRLGAETAAAVAVGITFFLLSQEQAPDPAGLIPVQGPVMAGLVMLILWGLVSAPTSARPVLGRAAS